LAWDWKVVGLGLKERDWDRNCERDRKSDLEGISRRTNVERD
jgi:hypothetical protein